jgi:hypothetical protein
MRLSSFSNLSVQSKLLLAFLLTSLLSILLTTGVGYLGGKNALERSTFNRLTATRNKQAANGSN